MSESEIRSATSTNAAPMSAAGVWMFLYSPPEVRGSTGRHGSTPHAAAGLLFQQRSRIRARKDCDLGLRTHKNGEIRPEEMGNASRGYQSGLGRDLLHCRSASPGAEEGDEEREGWGGWVQMDAWSVLRAVVESANAPHLRFLI
jgi:hypothetical protein